MDATKVRRPEIPREFYASSAPHAVLFFLFAAAFIVVGGEAAILIAKSGLSPALKVLLIAPLVVLASHGFHLMGWFAHEGIHLNLARSKYVSMVTGILVSGIALFPAVGYGITHWNHHRFTNQESDPDTRIYPRHRTFWSRFFLARITANRGYMRQTIALALGRPLDKGYRLPFTDAEQRRLAILTLANIALWIAIYAFVTWLDPVVGLLGAILPLAASLPLTGLRIYLEHNGTDGGVFRDTRSYVSPFYTVLMFGNNMHLEHHLYPHVPCYRLPKVHRHLRDAGHYERWGSHICPGILAPLRFTGSRYQYPSPQIADLPADPFNTGLAGEQRG